MNIGVISDLHIDRHKSLKPKDYEYELIKAIQRNQVELLLIAGDISNNYKLTQAFIKSVEAQAQIKVLFIPGNHDFWSADTNATSAEILE